MSACDPWYDAMWMMLAPTSCRRIAMMLVATSCHDAGEHFLPWWWWGKTASLQSALSLPHKIDVGQMLQKQSASADNLWLTSWLGKTMSFKRRSFFDNLDLTSWTYWQTVKSSNLLGGKYILLAIFSSLLDKQLVQTKALSWENPIFCRFQYKTGLLNPLSLYYSLFNSNVTVREPPIVSFPPRTNITPNNFLS